MTQPLENWDGILANQPRFGTLHISCFNARTIVKGQGVARHIRLRPVALASYSARSALVCIELMS